MLPFSNLILINKNQNAPVYIQICNSFIRLIQDGILKKGGKLPGTRSLASSLGIHRKTVIAAFEELHAQGWIKIESSSGAFISDSLPDIKPKTFTKSIVADRKSTGFAIKSDPVLSSEVYKRTNLLEINDGFPDERIAPMDSLSRTIRAILKGERGKAPFSYSDIEGNIQLRFQLGQHLNETRGFNGLAENIFITRGTIMGLYLSLSVLLEKGDNVIVEKPGYRSVALIIQKLGGNLVKVPVDEGGMIVNEVEKICQQKKIRAIYVTPHHQYPTTVTMPPERRIALLSLAEKYGIAILEDDYDYDYHFRHSPFLPLASSDPAGCVIYIGSFSKTFSPAFRVGYIYAPQNFIQEIAKLRRVIDRQGDAILELAFAEMLKFGDIKSHLKKSHNAYKVRRDYFCNLLKERLGDEIDFKVPEGGMAVWGKFNNVDLQQLTPYLASLGVYMSDGKHFQGEGRFLNSTRLGFASLNLEEIEKAIGLLEKGIKDLRGMLKR